jgi:hypothetical protein
MIGSSCSVAGSRQDYTVPQQDFTQDLPIIDHRTEDPGVVWLRQNLFFSRGSSDFLFERQVFERANNEMQISAVEVTCAGRGARGAFG